jgi:hypothetical protein
VVAAAAVEHLHLVLGVGVVVAAEVLSQWHPTLWNLRKEFLPFYIVPLLALIFQILYVLLLSINSCYVVDVHVRSLEQLSCPIPSESPYAPYSLLALLILKYEKRPVRQKAC